MNTFPITWSHCSFWHDGPIFGWLRTGPRNRYHFFNLMPSEDWNVYAVPAAITLKHLREIRLFRHSVWWGSDNDHTHFTQFNEDGRSTPRGLRDPKNPSCPGVWQCGRKFASEESKAAFYARVPPADIDIDSPDVRLVGTTSDFQNVRWLSVAA